MHEPFFVIPPFSTYTDFVPVRGPRAGSKGELGSKGRNVSETQSLACAHVEELTFLMPSQK